MASIELRWDRWPVAKRLVPSLRRRLWAVSHRGRSGVVKRHGARFLILDDRNWADMGVLMHGVIERDQLCRLVAEIRARAIDTFLDIGANMGVYSVMVARETRCARIIAFEPDRRSFAQLEANLRLNGLGDRVEARRVAVSDRNGEAPFVPGPATHNVWSKIASPAEAGATVPAVRLDDALALAGRRVALKIDIEGHETAALAGMKTLLADNACLLQVECWAANAAPFAQAMRALGYDLKDQIAADYYFANF
jgi:FkbM family methyltransferase